MKTLIISILLSALLGTNTNMELVIYERFINQSTYDNLGATSIWKYNSDYRTALQEAWAREEPLYSVSVER